MLSIANIYQAEGNSISHSTTQLNHKFMAVIERSTSNKQCISLSRESYLDVSKYILTITSLTLPENFACQPRRLCFGGGSGIFQCQISYIPEGPIPVCPIFIFQYNKMLFQPHCDLLYSFSFIASIHYSYAEISKYSIFFVFWKTIFNIQYSASSPGSYKKGMLRSLRKVL